MGEKNKPIGIVSATSVIPSSENSLNFFISKEVKEGSVKDSIILGTNDIIKIRRKNTNDEVFAVITNVSHFTDAPGHVSNFVSYNFGQIDPNDTNKPRMGFCIVSADIIYNENDVFFPVQTGDIVYLCDKEEIDTALYMKVSEKSGKYIPIAECTMYKGNGEEKEKKVDIKMHTSYLVGPSMAHLNISGISGGAAKTTKAMHIAKSLYENLEGKISIVLFNTKKDDLLSIDKPKQGTNGEVKYWFKNVEYLRPYTKKGNNKDYVIKYQSLVESERLDMLVAGDPDESGTMDSCTKEMINLSDKENVADWKVFKEKVPKKTDGVNEQSWKKYKRLVDRIITRTSESIFDNNGGVDLLEKIEGYMNKNKVIVVDIASLDRLQQAFVFGCVISKINEEMSKQSKKVLVFVDELNTYASKGTPDSSSILQALITMSEQGRSSGLCLMTAEQSLSVIHPRIKNNFGSQIIGRTSPLELSSYDYVSLPDAIKTQIARFKQGEAILMTPTINAGFIKAEFSDKFYEES